MNGPLNKFPAQAMPGKIADVLSRIEDRRESRAASAHARLLPRDDEILKQSRELAALIATTTTKEHYAHALEAFTEASKYVVFPLASVSVDQVARLSSSASGTKFLLALTHRSDPNSRRLFGCTLPGAALQSSGDGDEGLDAIIHHHVVVLDTADGWVMCSCFRPLRCGTWCKHLWAVWTQGHLCFTPLLLHPAWLLPDSKRASRTLVAGQRCYSSIRRKALAPAQRALALVDVTTRARHGSIVDLYRDDDASWSVAFWATAAAYDADSARGAWENDNDDADDGGGDDDEAGGKGGFGKGGSKGRGAGARDGDAAENDDDDDDGRNGGGWARRGAAAKTGRRGASAKRLKVAGSREDLVQRTHRLRELAEADPNVHKRLVEAMEDVESFAQRSTDERFQKRLASAVHSRTQRPSSGSTPAPRRQSPPVRTSKHRKMGAADFTTRKSPRASARRNYTDSGIDAQDNETRTVVVRASGRPRKRTRDEE